MKNNENYTTHHFEITKRNELEFIQNIRTLFSYLWKNKDDAFIKAWLYRYSNPIGSIVKLNEKIIGFSLYYSLLIDKRKVLFRAGAVIAPNHRRKGLYFRLLRESIKKHIETSLIVCVRTREIAVYKSMHKLHAENTNSIIYPDIFIEYKQTIPKDIIEIMSFFSGSQKTKDIPVAKKVYSKRSTSILQKHYGFGVYDALMVVVNKSTD